MSSALKTPVRLKSGCKINLCLEITGQRSDGYHTLHSYFLPLAEPHDVMVVSAQEPPHRGSGCLVNSGVTGIDPRNNTLTKAYNLLREFIPQLPAIAVELRKGVPQGAGLGGGSANAAALLNFLNELAWDEYAAGLSTLELANVAAQVGADVPFFLVGEPAWVSGIGEVIKPDVFPLEPYRNMHLALVCPPIHVSTLWAFREWDKMQNLGANALTSPSCHDSNNSAEAIRFFNSLEEPVLAVFPELGNIKKELLELGAEHALMSGSGSSIFGLFASKDAALAASGALREQGLKVYTQALYTGVSPSW